MSPLVCIVGPSASGKTSILGNLGRNLLGARVESMPPWPEFETFQRDPLDTAFQNQRGALRSVRTVFQRAASSDAHLVLTDASVLRVRLHNRALHSLGLISDPELVSLEQFCDSAENAYLALPKLILNLFVSAQTRMSREKMRERAEDADDFTRLYHIRVFEQYTAYLSHGEHLVFSTERALSEVVSDCQKAILGWTQGRISC